MLLTVDIGNSDTVLGIFSEQTLQATFRYKTKKQLSQDDTKRLRLFLEKHTISPYGITQVAVACVVPDVLEQFVSALPSLSLVKPLVLSSETDLPIKLLVDNPKEVGADIIANMVAAYTLFGGTVLVLDLGTITTCDLLRDGAFVGTVITPGMGTMAKAMSDSGAFLPTISLKKPTTVMGKNTIDCMRSGVYFGYVGLIEGLLARIKQENPEVKVVITGGYSNLVGKEIKGIDVFYPTLTLEGLRIIHEYTTTRSLSA